MHNFGLSLVSPSRDIERYWEFSVGSCRAYTALRADYRKYLTQCRRELGFRYIRFHGIFDDALSVLQKDMLTGNYVLSFANVDDIIDFLLSIGMKPFLELGFMPSCLASGKETVFHYRSNVTPPRDEETWSWFIRCFVQHLVDRYGRAEVRTWFFEVWNEPNLGGDEWVPGGSFWSGDMNAYYRLYELTARAVKSVDSALPVGGPATSNNAFIPEMLAYCRKRNVPIDFVSTHHYPTDVVLGYGVEDSLNFVKDFKKTQAAGGDAMKRFAQEFLTFREDIWKRVDRGVLTDMARRAVAEADGLPLYYTEWSSLAGLAADGPFGAAFIAKTILDNMGLVKGYSYWTFSDILEEAGQRSAPFHGGYGLMTLQGVPKAPYRAFQLLHMLRGRMYEARYAKGTVDVYAFDSRPQRMVQYLLVNHDSLLHPIRAERVSLSLTDCGAARAHLEIYRVDEAHANALAAWKRMGEPEYVTEAQTQQLLADSALVRETAEIEIRNGCLAFDVDLPEQGVALVNVLLDEV